MQYKLRLNVGWFVDGNILPVKVERGQEITVNEATKTRLMNSDPEAWEIVGYVGEEVEEAEGSARRMCSATKTDGTRCVLPAQPGLDLCHVHKRMSENAQN